MATQSRTTAQRRRVLVEMRGDAQARGMAMAQGLGVKGFALDDSFEAVPLGDPSAAGMAAADMTYVVRGEIDVNMVTDLEGRADVVAVWSDAEIAPLGMLDAEEAQSGALAPADCPIPPCDCESWVPKGTLADVAAYLKVDQVWAQGFNGNGITIGIVDGGITAQGRTISTADTGAPSWPNKLVPNVTGGWPTASWGTTGVNWDWHGNMTATDAMGIAPGAKVYDLRISDAGSATGLVSNALAAFQWALNQFKSTGQPKILSNSWGMWQKNWAADYATNPNHPFTKKVVEAIDAGMIVLFAAGNCGLTCGGSKCGTDKGPGKSIWGANGHPRVMTVGAVNKNEQFIGYSSQGPAALDAKKPDFCGISHFTGFFNSDSGTSAACPVVAGIAALMKQGTPAATHDAIKKCLQTTAKDIGAAGWDPHSGHGIVQGKAAFDCVRPPVIDIVKVLKDRLTLKRLDELTVAWKDQRVTIAALDRITVPSSDRLTTPTVDRITTSILDQGGTIKAVDDVKSARLDKNPASDRVIIPGREVLPARRGLGAVPFALSTPHHAASAEQLDAALGGRESMADMAHQHLEAMQEIEQAMVEFEAAAEDAMARAAEADGALAEVQAGYQTLVEEYRQLAAGLAELVAALEGEGDA